MHYCERGQTNTADGCNARGYCECECGYVRLLPFKGNVWITREEMTSRASAPPADTETSSEMFI